MRMILGGLFTFALSIGFCACGDKSDPAQDSSEIDIGSLDEVSYCKPIKEILDKRCVTCHSSILSGSTRKGAPPSVNLDTYEGAKKSAKKSNSTIQRGSMPPSAGMPDSEREAFDSWVKAGMPEACQEDAGN
ncbi:MAG: hypothetical protein Kow0090_02770 [Myxococcota bacterium]